MVRPRNAACRMCCSFAWRTLLAMLCCGASPPASFGHSPQFHAMRRPGLRPKAGERAGLIGSAITPDIFVRISSPLYAWSIEGWRFGERLSPRGNYMFV